MSINKLRKKIKKELQKKYELTTNEFNGLMQHYAQKNIIAIADIKKQLEKDVNDIGKNVFFLGDN